MEFSLTANAEFSDAHRVDVLAEVMEHLDLNDAQTAATYLQTADVQRAWQMDSRLSGDHSDNNSEESDDELDDDHQVSSLAWPLCRVFISCYEDSINDLTLTPSPDKLSIRIEAEGRDNEANDFVVILAQLLIAAGARRLTIQANSECWRGTWRVIHDEVDVDVSPLG